MLLENRYATTFTLIPGQTIEPDPAHNLALRPGGKVEAIVNKRQAFVLISCCFSSHIRHIINVLVMKNESLWL